MLSKEYPQKLGYQQIIKPNESRTATTDCGCIMCWSCIMETLQHPISPCTICSDEEVAGCVTTPIFPANLT
ncbi:hypothetical protein Bhyg_04226 [Pseudolycoriella hygida]|uniref:Uncharacterized protein n=1 Tax=Pseudolycoriella hygida TaxID=35572 RepID=A0A9Q0NGC9_9DIPT|nr:hypothetical protein Bhyg_04226 [Pseudolycoriella hygida]